MAAPPAFHLSPCSAAIDHRVKSGDDVSGHCADRSNNSARHNTGGIEFRPFVAVNVRAAADGRVKPGHDGYRKPGHDGYRKPAMTGTASPAMTGTASLAMTGNTAITIR
jgi:hypothetical protein